MIRNLVALTALTLSAGAASAQVDPGLADLIEEISGDRAVDVIYQDFDGDKILEAVVVDRDPREDGAGRDWKLLASQPEPIVALHWLGDEVRVEIDEPRGPVIWSDGITWAFDGERAYPHYDLVREEISKLRQPTDQEVGFLGAAGYTDVVKHYTEVLKLDLGAAPGFELLIALNDDAYRGPDFDTPYLIFSQSGELLFEGRSVFHPAIFRHPEGGIQLIEDRGEHLELIRLPLTQPK